MDYLNENFREFSTSFIVFPQDTNYMYPMVFGGKVMAEMDIAAAMAVRRALIVSHTAKDAVTTRARNIQFHVGATVGDLVELNAKIVKLGVTSIEIDVEGFRELKDGTRERICNGVFTFVTVEFQNERSFSKVPHNLTLDRF